MIPQFIKINSFWMNCLQSFSSGKILKIFCKVCLDINGKQATNVPVSKHKIQLHPLAIYADFESNLKKFIKLVRDNSEASYTDKYQNHIAVMVTKFYAQMINLVNQCNNIKVEMESTGKL